MADTRTIRRFALLALYQLDARASDTDAEADLEDIRDSLADAASFLDETDGQRFVDETVELTERDKRRAVDLAVAAWRDRDAADTTLQRLAPAWRPARLAPIDRSILRLAHHELRAGKSPPKAVANEAVELAKAFSTAKSRQFVNGVVSSMIAETVPSTGPAASPDTSPDTGSNTAPDAASQAT